MLRLANENFLPVFDHYDDVLKAHGQLSITWMGIPSRGKMHIPSCDFTALTSTEAFCEFYLPTLQNEVRHMTHNIFHVDGKGMLRHLDHILSIPQIQAIQWVQGVGDDLPILQWLPVIKRIQAAGKGVVVDLQLRRAGALHRGHETRRPLPLHRGRGEDSAGHSQAAGEVVTGGRTARRYLCRAGPLLCDARG